MRNEIPNNVNELRFVDKLIQCKICGQMFCFSAGEQLYFSDRNLNEPKRCPRCRQRAKGGSGNEY